MKNNSVLIIVVVAVLVGAGAFFGGMKYQQGKQSATRQQFSGQRGVQGQNRQGGRTAFQPVAGEIISADDKSITVKLNDGSSKIVILSEKTSLNKASEATKADLKVGEKVAVFGSDNSDGSVTAQNIQLNPVLRGFTVNPSPTGTAQ